MLSSTIQLPQDNNETLFKLILLGTDTYIEKDNLLVGYERGETLNAVFRSLQGAEFKDKHIVSGADTSGRNTNSRAIEALLMSLKALSEGKTKIKIAAHSRGGVEAMLVVNALEKIIACLKNPTCNASSLVEELKKVSLGYLSDAFKKELKFNKDNPNVITFESRQKKDLGTKLTKEHQIDINKLIENAKKNELNCELFVIDPVPGQSLTQLLQLQGANWAEPEFFEIPKLVNRAQYIYMSHERSNFFEPIIPNAFPRACEVQIFTLPGHHGTASGWLEQQVTIGGQLINLDNKNATTAIEKAKKETRPSQDNLNANTTSTTNGSNAVPKPVPTDQVMKGRETRHVQKLVIAKLVEFFGPKAFAEYSKTNEPKHASGMKTPHISKTLYRYLAIINNADEMKNYKLQLYGKMWNRLSEYQKFTQTHYGTFINKDGKRQTIVGSPDNRYILVEFNEHSELRDRLVSYVNDEHIILAISNFLKSPIKHEWSPIDVMRYFSDTLDISKLYKDRKTAEIYNAYYNKIVFHFICEQVQNILAQQGDQASSLNKVEEMYQVINTLKAKAENYEDINKSKKPASISSMLAETWNDIIHNAIMFQINIIDNELKRLLESIHNNRTSLIEERLQLLENLSTKVKNHMNGLMEIENKGLLKQSYKDKYNYLELMVTTAISLTRADLEKAQLIAEQDRNTQLKAEQARLEAEKAAIDTTRRTLEQEQLRLRVEQAQFEMEKAAIEEARRALEQEKIQLRAEQTRKKTTQRTPPQNDPRISTPGTLFQPLKPAETNSTFQLSDLASSLTPAQLKLFIETWPRDKACGAEHLESLLFLMQVQKIPLEQAITLVSNLNREEAAAVYKRPSA